uniref:Uncharacterized protein n=1 Tax=Rhizophora mucronata TaxID=61149 RepID=A0A2P2IXB8_RHIMU
MNIYSLSQNILIYSLPHRKLMEACKAV